MIIKVASHTVSKVREEPTDNNLGDYLKWAATLPVKALRSMNICVITSKGAVLGPYKCNYSMRSNLGVQLGVLLSFDSHVTIKNLILCDRSGKPVWFHLTRPQYIKHGFAGFFVLNFYYNSWPKPGDSEYGKYSVNQSTKSFRASYNGNTRDIIQPEAIQVKL